MKLSDLDFNYPKVLVATEPSRPSRVAFVADGQSPQELDMLALLDQFNSGDLLVVNDSQVIPARIFAADQSEILFLQALGPTSWQVLFPAREYKVGNALELPDGLTVTLTQKGLPQIVTTSREIHYEYFQAHGEVALPPYIQEARGERRNRAQDRQWYQTAWAEIPGSVAAPTASLHFTPAHLAALAQKGVGIERITLHVGAGTFLPIRSENLDAHEMHAESVRIPAMTLSKIKETQKNGGRIWALGTTVTRSLEAWALGELALNADGDAIGHTKLFIRPPYEFRVIGGLLTNFHQPRSTLLGLVGAFAGLDRVKSAYNWAIARKFKLFSYGDLSVWIR